jgi:UDP:flavonoid glycosyltransferase YjiC (YdhE family)
VLISGAGLIGLILACELALAKCSVLILERAENPHSPLKQLPFGLRGLSAPSVEAHYRRGLGCEDHARASFHPFYDNEGRQPIPFPCERLNGKPLIYASMGRLANGLRKVYGTILEAASEFPEMQMVLSVGRNFNPDDLGRIPSNTNVVRAAPQIDLLKRAALCITHAGLNTALEALAQGVPMVAIPVGFDQPGVAARIAYHGVGEFIEVGNLTTRRLSDLIAKIAENPTYRDKASWFQKVLWRLVGWRSLPT